MSGNAQSGLTCIVTTVKGSYTRKWLGSYPIHLENRRLILKARADDEVRCFSVAIQVDYSL